MSKTLTFEIPDEIYRILEKDAEREGRTTESVALEWLVSCQPKRRAKLTHSYVLAEFVPLCQTRGLLRVEALVFA